MKINATLQKLIVEFLGVTLFLTAIGAAISSSGTQLASAGIAITLGLAILVTGGLSGGHLNPIVSLYFFSKKELSLSDLFGYIIAQIAGGLVGIWIGMSIWGKTVSGLANGRNATLPELIGEWVITGGLVFLVGYLASNKKGNLIPVAVALWVFAGLQLTSTGAQANPAVTIALLLAGHDVGVQGGLIIAQVVGAASGIIGIGVFNAKAVKAKKAGKK
jgi:glycerol uptake facilitator-like aquaporin